MKRLFLILLYIVGSQSVSAATLYQEIAPFTLYSEEQELFTVDLSDAVAINQSTGAVTYNPVYRIRNGYNPSLKGKLLFKSVGNYFGYQSLAGMANTTEQFNVLIDMKDGTTLWPNYTMNVLSFSSLIQLLNVPSFNIYTSGGYAYFIISAYDRETNQAVARKDIMGIDVVSSGYYAPTKGTVSPDPGGLPDVFTYRANPGATGWDRLLVFFRNEAGKMGYNFFYVYIP